MRGFTFLVLAAVAGIGFTAPMVTMMSLLIAVLLLATMVQNGLTGTASLALAPGFMALVASRAT